MTSKKIDVKSIVESVRKSGKSIYDEIEIGSDLWLPAAELEALLDSSLRGLNLEDYPIRTRSKVVKSKICEALGYPVPSTFKKTRPRFVGQCFDTYTQKSNNLQVWNEDLSPTRRYVIIGVDSKCRVSKVKVVTGDSLSELDTTGTLTQKYQARLNVEDKATELVAAKDTDNLQCALQKNVQKVPAEESPINYPSETCLLPIGVIYTLLSSLVGSSFADAGSDQERNRGAKLHMLICRALGYNSYKDDGQFPDVKNQLLEVKLQTSPTIDLGLVTPSSDTPLDIPKIGEITVRHCDVRYAVFYAKLSGGKVNLTHFFLTTGEKFFSRFPRFEGKVLNKKLQIRLPKDFFD